MKEAKGLGLDKLNVTVRIYSPLIDNYFGDKRKFRSKTYAAEKASEVYPHIRELGLDSLKGFFEEHELELLLEIFSLERDPRFIVSVDSLKCKLKENSKFLKQDEGVEESILKLNDKINEMNDFQAIVFSEWLTTFLSFKGTYKGKVKVQFKEYIGRLL